MPKEQGVDLKKNLSDLARIVKWFEDQKDIDLDASLDKVKEAAKIIKESRSRIKDVENSFKEIEKDLIEEGEVESPPDSDISNVSF